MANTKISALSAASALDGTEVLPVVQGAATVKATGQQLVTLANGSAGLTGATETTSKPLLNHAQTWNDAGVTFVGWKIDITNTASAAGSLLADWQVGGVSQLSISKTGGSILMPQATAATVAAAGIFFGTARSGSGPIALAGFNNSIYGYAQGQQIFFASIIKLALNSAQRMGWTSSTTANDGTFDAAFARKQAKIPEVNDGTAGSYVGTGLLLGPMTVAQLPTAASGLKGLRATVSDATATTFLSTVAGTGANIVPVFCNGTDWLIG